MTESWTTRGLVALVFATSATSSLGCSDAPQSGVPAPSGPTLAAGASEQTAPAPPRAPALGAHDVPYAFAVPMPSSSRCVIHPEGITDDSTRSDTVYAGADGEIRFRQPPEAWGTRLTLECTLDGGQRTNAVVDLNDSSTFKSESRSDLEPRVMGVRPALTGDLSTVSRDELRQLGYPPRPDPQKNPEKYAAWVKKVTKPADLLDAVQVSALGTKATTYEGSSTIGAWTGFAQSASGFTAVYGDFAANWGTLYEEYEAEMLAPVNFGCTNCSTSAIWVGIGGVQTEFLGGALPTSLIQSGFYFQPRGTTVEIDPYIEFAPGGVKFLPRPGNQKYAGGDVFTIWGWAADANCNLNTAPSYACFWFEDDTNNWVINGSVPAPTGAKDINGNTIFWVPSTVEYIAEKNGPGQNPNYWFDSMQGMAWDSNGTLHTDPGDPNGTDPYVMFTQIAPSGNPYSTAQWNKGSLGAPQDPIVLVWGSAQ
jgi:hypothetical protein